MRCIYLYFLGVTVLTLGFVTLAGAQDKPAAAAETSGTPKAGPRAEFLEEIAYYEQRYMRIAEAMPVEKYP